MLFEPRQGKSGTVRLVFPMRDASGELEGLLLGEIELGRGDLFDDSVRGSGPVPHQLSLFGPSGSPLFSAGSPAVETGPWERARDALRRGEGGAIRTEVDGQPHVLAWAPIARTGAGLVYVWPWDELDPHRTARGRGLLSATLVMALVGMGVGLLLARRITRPMLSLARDVGEARAGGAGIDRGRGGDEVAELRRAFAELVDEVRADRDRIAELADTLEERVAQRTKQLEEARDALIDAERLAALGRAGAALSHELRNSLNTLSIGLDALGPSERSKAPIRQQVRAEIARLRSLADLLLDFARPRSLRPKPARAGELLARSLALVEEHASDHAVVVEVDAQTPEAMLEVDADLVQSVLSNLVRNAVDAVAALEPEARRVAVQAGVSGPRWIVTVDDAGRGVSSAVRPHLFQPFVSGRPGGVGLGLAVARRFVELHGGTLSLVEGRLGGACFAVDLPLRP